MWSTSDLFVLRGECRNEYDEYWNAHTREDELGDGIYLQQRWNGRGQWRRCTRAIPGQLVKVKVKASHTDTERWARS